MYAAVRNSWPLLLGLGLLMVGNGLQISLVGIRASLEGFPAAITGFVMSGYYLGFLLDRLGRHEAYDRICLCRTLYRL